MPDSQITATAYEPDDELRDLLAEPLSEATVSYGDERDLDLSGDLEATQREHTITLDDFDVSGFETYSSLGFLLSLEGHLGLASAVALSHAMVLGVPTQSYLDEAPPASLIDDPYQDLSVEWYHQAAVREGVPEARLERRVGDLDHDLLGSGELERYTRVWLSAGE